MVAGKFHHESPRGFNLSLERKEMRNLNGLGGGAGEIIAVKKKDLGGLVFRRGDDDDGGS